MRVYLGSDHAGYELKAHLAEQLAKRGHDVVDVGPHVFDPDDDYPAFCLHTAARVVGDPGSLGVVVGGSGNGEQIAANKVDGVRAALAWKVEIARLAREHNDANVISIGAREHTVEVATGLVQLFLGTPFSEDPRHVRRIGLVSDYERDRHRPAGGLPTRSDEQ
jgi:ribose 5-phosphate isomerase B